VCLDQALELLDRDALELNQRVKLLGAIHSGPMGWHDDHSGLLR
jgi:hypothetical protein